MYLCILISSTFQSGIKKLLNKCWLNYFLIALTAINAMANENNVNTIFKWEDFLESSD